MSTPTPSSAPTSPSSANAQSRLRRTGVFLGHHWWQGVGVIVAVIIAVIIWLVPSGDSKPAPAPKASPAVNVSGPVNGNCNAQGQGNQVSCVYPPSPKSLGHISLRWGGSVLFLFAGSAKELPTPPDYPLSKKLGHCDDWGDWLSRQPRVYGLTPSVHMSMISGEPDLVVVHNIQAQVIDRKPLNGNYVLIECQYGAGLDSGYLVTLDVGSNITQVTDQATGKVAQMPPASLSLKGRDYESALISIKSTSGILYGGVITLSTNVNGQEQQILLGSPQRQFRWLGGEGEDPIMTQLTDQTPKYDWNPTTHQWVQVIHDNPPAA
jgi:hypothetical protein